MNLLTLTGPSCSGKTTLANKLIAEYGYASIVSHTTRPPRPGEQDGIDYYFIDDDHFNSLKAQNAFVETIEFNGYQYGVNAKVLERVSATGKNLVLIVDPHGLRQIRNFYKDRENINLFSIYVDGHEEVLISRYINRLAGEDLSDLKTANRHARRIQSLIREIKDWEPKGLFPSPYAIYNVTIHKDNMITLEDLERNAEWIKRKIFNGN